MSTDTSLNHYFHSNGKLLLTGEYFVLHGAKALALPLKMGQSMTVIPSDLNQLIWESYTDNGVWFTASFNNQIDCVDTSDKKRANIIQTILKHAFKLAGKEPSMFMNLTLKHHLQFNPDWGWGSSSTLINNIAQWVGVNPFELSAQTLGGSNYDIACAGASAPIYYQLINGLPTVDSVKFAPPFSNYLYLVFLNHKQDSRLSVAEVTKKGTPSPSQIAQISLMTTQIANCNSLQQFQELLMLHEALVANYTGFEPVGEKYFSDFNGAVKSLGAWGGDFILVASNMPYSETFTYFKTKGYSTLFRLDDIVLNNV